MYNNDLFNIIINGIFINNTSGDFNDLDSAGSFWIYPTSSSLDNWQNAPFSAPLVLVVFRCSNCVMQLALSYTGNSFYQRIRWGANNWKEWKSINLS